MLFGVVGFDTDTDSELSLTTLELLKLFVVVVEFLLLFDVNRIGLRVIIVSVGEDEEVVEEEEVDDDE